MRTPATVSLSLSLAGAAALALADPRIARADAGDATGPAHLDGASAGASTAAAADGARWELGVGSAARWMPSASADALTDGGMAAFSLSGARTLGWRAVPGFELLAEGALEVGATGGTTFRRVDAAAGVALVALGLRARRDMCRACPAWRRWTLGARAQVGAARVSVSLEDALAGSADDSIVRDRDHTAAAYVGAGIDYTPIRAGAGGQRFALGLRAELGYLAMRPVAIDGAPDRMDDGAIRIPATTAALGDLDLSAVSLRIALISRF